MDELDDLINKISIFGFHFASLDIRQNSKVHNHVINTILNALNQDGINREKYFLLSENEKINFISNLSSTLPSSYYNDEITKATLDSILAIKTIQENNGELGANRYIISNNESALNVIETLSLFRMCNWENPNVDIIPLFESITDLHRADSIMEQLYTNDFYAQHLKKKRQQTNSYVGFL